MLAVLCRIAVWYTSTAWLSCQKMGNGCPWRQLYLAPASARSPQQCCLLCLVACREMYPAYWVPHIVLPFWAAVPLLALMGMRRWGKAGLVQACCLPVAAKFKFFDNYFRIAAVSSGCAACGIRRAQ